MSFGTKYGESPVAPTIIVNETIVDSARLCLHAKFKMFTAICCRVIAFYNF